MTTVPVSVPEDVPVRSRVSFAAIIAGVVAGSGPRQVVAGFPVRSRFDLPVRRGVVVNR